MASGRRAATAPARRCPRRGGHAHFVGRATVVYHADPCHEPCPSWSFARILWAQSTQHAFVARPRLGGTLVGSAPTRPKELGTAVHKRIRPHGRVLVAINAGDWKSMEDRRLRAAAYADGDAPTLRIFLDGAEALAERIRSGIVQLPDCGGIPIADIAFVAIAHAPEGLLWRIMSNAFENRPDRT